MALETGQTFDPAAFNSATSATGLIQFMPNYSVKITGFTTTQLGSMSALRQLDEVKIWLMPYRGKMQTLIDTYMAIFSPAYIGKSPDYVAYAYPSKGYVQNSGFDTMKTGKITLADISIKVLSNYQEGLKRGNYG